MNTAERRVMRQPPKRLLCSSDRGGKPCVKILKAGVEDSSHVREEGLTYNNAGDNLNVSLIDSPLPDVDLRGKGIPKLPSPLKKVDQGYENDIERGFGVIAAIGKYALYMAATNFVLFQAITKYVLFQAFEKFVLFQALTKFVLFQAYLQHIVATGKKQTLTESIFCLDNENIIDDENNMFFSLHSK